MTGDEHTALIQKIRQSLSDEGQVSTLLAQLSEDYTNVLADSAEKTTKAEQLTKDNESLRSANMQLFLKVGNNPGPEKKDPEDKPEDKKLSFENLFNEKGGLK